MLDLQMCLTLLKQAERKAKNDCKKGAQDFDAIIEIGTGGDGYAEIAPFWRGESYQEFHCSWDKLADMLSVIRENVSMYMSD